MYSLQLTDRERQCLRAAFQMYQKEKRKEAAHNRTEDSKKWATVLETIEILQEKLGFPDDKKLTNN